MHCPHCDMYSIDPVTCSHCGQRLPDPVQSHPVSRSQNVSGSRLWLVLMAAVVVIGLGWWLFKGGSGPIPPYMDQGPVYLSQQIVPGQTNIVDMYSEYCPPCRQISPWLEKLDEARDDIHVVKVDINRAEVKGIDWNGPIARQFKLRSIPHFIIIGPDGQLVSEGKPAYKQVVSWIEAIARP